MYKKIILLIIIVILSIIFGSLYVDMSQPRPRDIARLPTKMDVEIIKTNNGYLITILNVGDFRNGSAWFGLELSTETLLKWQIWDAKNVKEVCSGYLSNASTIVRLNDTNLNGIIDFGDTIFILSPSHEYGGYYFIVTYEAKKITVIHERFPT